MGKNKAYSMFDGMFPRLISVKGEKNMFCENCGNHMDDGSKFCMACGAKVTGSSGGQVSAEQEIAAGAEGVGTIQPDAPAIETQAPPQQFTPPVQPQQPQQFRQTQPAQSQPPRPQPVPQQQVPQQWGQPQPMAAPRPTKPPKNHSTAPLSVWKYIGIFLLMGIPVLGIIMIFIWNFGSNCNQNTKNLARAVLIMLIVFLVASIVGYFTVWNQIAAFLSDYTISF